MLKQIDYSPTGRSDDSEQWSWYSGTMAEIEAQAVYLRETLVDSGHVKAAVWVDGRRLRRKDHANDNG